MKNSLLEIQLLEVSTLRHIEMFANKHSVTERTIPFTASVVGG